MLGITKDLKLVSGEQYLRHRIRTALETPQGSVPFNRLFGSRLTELLDNQITDDLLWSMRKEVYSVFDNPKNYLSDIKLEHVDFFIDGARLEIALRVNFSGHLYEVAL